MKTKKTKTSCSRRRVVPKAKLQSAAELSVHDPHPLHSLTNDVTLGYQRHRVGAALPWDHERHAVRTSWAKLSNDIGPRDSGRGVRYGM